jgi:release factor glutamine methyltransferase
MTTSSRRRSLKARLWRLGLRARFLLWHRRRHGRLVLEHGLGLPLVVLPGVLNPALFRSSPVALGCLDGDVVPTGCRVLDLGTGTGVLGLAAAARGALVVAVDLDPRAVRCARINALLNGLEARMEVREGDLFGPVAGERFDLVLSNPPYYAGPPSSSDELALFGGDFAERFAAGLSDHLSATGRALVVLSSDGAEAAFLEAFADHGLECSAVHRRDLVSEVVTVYRVRPAAP